MVTDVKVYMMMILSPSSRQTCLKRGKTFPEEGLA